MTPQFGKKTIGNFNTSSTKIHYKLVKNYKKRYEFFNTISTQFQHYRRGCYLVNVLSVPMTPFYYIITFIT